MNNKEEWRAVVGHEGSYEVSDQGRVKSLARNIERGEGIIQPIKGRVLKSFNASGYLSVALCGKAPKTTYVHRIVAQAFIDNPDSKRTVNHKNGIKDDNRLENLEWNTYSENTRHSFEVLGHKGGMMGKFGKDHPRSKPVVQMTLDGSFVAEYAGQHEASRITGVNRGHISSVCTGRIKTAGGFKWKFKS